MARRVNQLFRNATIYESRALAEQSIKNQEKVDGDIILVRYKEPGDTEITTIAGLQTSIGNQQSVTLIATQKDLDSLKNSANPLLSKHSKEITNLQEALVTEAGLTEGTENVTINGQQVAVKTFSYPGMGATNYLSRTVSIIDALHQLDSSLANVEEKVDKANNTNSYDSSINISDEGQGWNFEVNIKSGEHILSSSGNEGLYTNLTLEKITTTNNSPYAAQYKLKGTDGTYLGDTIDIPRDQVIKRAYLADANNVEIISSDTTSIAKYMVFEVYTGTDSTTTTTLSVDISRFFEELEVGNIANNITGNGLKFNSTSNKIDVKIDSTSEGYLTVSANGIKLNGITSAINTALQDKVDSSDLATIAISGSYNDLLDKPTIPTAPGTLNTNATTGQSTNASESLSGNITLHKISKTGSYNDLIGIPTITPIEPSGSSHLTDVPVWENMINTVPVYSTTGLYGGNNTTSDNYNDVTYYWDTAPTFGSTKAVTSGGVYTALLDKVNSTSLAAVATSGNYNDLNNKPIIPATYAGSSSVGGAANKAAAIPFGEVDSTSTSHAFTATVDGITELRDGICCYLKNDVVTSAAASTAPKCWTLNINSLGAKPVYVTNNAATYSTTHFAKNYKFLFTYDESLNSGNGGWYINILYNTNTTYSVVSQSEINAGTSTASRSITAKMLRDNFYTEDEVDALLDDKQDVIDDLTAIRSGAALGATALQSFTESDPTVPAWAKAANKPSYTASEVGALPDTTTIPTITFRQW